MPGAEVTERVDDQNYKAKLTTAVGPIRPTFDVKARVERDESAKEGEIDVDAVDRRGGSQARAKIVYRLSEQDGRTKVEIDQNVTLSGPLAQFGRTGIIEDINTQMTRQFAACLETRLSAPAGGPSPAAAQTSSGEVRVVRLILAALMRRLAALFRPRRR